MRTFTAIGFLVGLATLPFSTADTYCDASTACEVGCCGVNNVCGTGPDYCSDEKCINSCTYKAECNPGDWDEVYFNASSCPLNVCCSKYGFCGTTELFCGDDSVTRPSCDVDSQSITRVIGYYASGGASRTCDGMIPQSFPQGVYSHINFAFGSIDPDTFKVGPATDADEALYPALRALQTRDLGQELWLSIGGWTFSDANQPTATTFSDLVNADITYQNVFFASLTLYMMTWGFTGVDIDWEYPAADDRNGREADYANLPVFLADLKDALDEYKYGLSLTLPTSYWYLQHFDLAAIEPSVDWFNYMSYDLHGTWDIGSEWTGAYLNAHTNLTEIETALDLLWRNDIPSSKVNLGLAFYGRSFTLASASCSEPGCAYLSAGDAGSCSGEAGILLSSEIKSIISNNDLTPTLYEDAAIKTITWGGDQWVSFDDQETFKIKADFAKSQCLGGVLVWSVDYDDGNSTYSEGLAAALGNELNVDTDTGLTLSMAATSSKDTTLETQNQYCRWSNCGETCGTGFTSIVRDDKTSQLMLDSTECPPGESQTQTLCCPTSSEVPTCRWRGFHNNGKCKGGCNDDEAEVGTISTGCSSGYQSACCTITESTMPWSKCQWTDSCYDDETCPSDYPNYVAQSRDGWGGRPSCSNGAKHKNYCCSGDAVPDAFTNCAWDGFEVAFTNEAYCSDACPSGSIRIAEQSISTLWGADKTAHTDGCLYGNEAYCCSGAKTSSSTSPRSTSGTIVYADETAEEFDAYLQKYLASPVCPAEWEAEYDADISLVVRDLAEQDLGAASNTQTRNDTITTMQRRPANPLSLITHRATDESITLTFLMPLISTWITSRYPREDLTEIWNTRIEEAGLGSEGANASVLTDTLYGDSWSGYPTYSPDTLIADVLCNIADSSEALLNMQTATEGLCVDYGEGAEDDDDDGDTSSEWKREETALSARNLEPLTMAARSANGVLPSIAAVLTGIMNGGLTLHYLRWLAPEGDQVILEMAYWIGSTVGVAPGGTGTNSPRYTYGDNSHFTSTTPDRWVVMHLHIPIDQYTFRGNTQGWYPGVTTVTMYHSQGYVRPSAVTRGESPDYRAEYRYSPNYASGSMNTGATAGFNDRAQALSCDMRGGGSGVQARWFIGYDNADNINALNAASGVRARPTELAALLNRFGIWFRGSRAAAGSGNAFSEANLAYLFPNLAAVRTATTTGRTPPRGTHNYQDDYAPQAGAFDYNWMPDGTSTPPDLSGADA